jgi:hypothetical protein
MTKVDRSYTPTQLTLIRKQLEKAHGITSWIYNPDTNRYIPDRVSTPGSSLSVIPRFFGVDALHHDSLPTTIPALDYATTSTATTATNPAPWPSFKGFKKSDLESTWYKTADGWTNEAFGLITSRPDTPSNVTAGRDKNMAERVLSNMATRIIPVNAPTHKLDNIRPVAYRGSDSLSVYELTGTLVDARYVDFVVRCVSKGKEITYKTAPDRMVAIMVDGTLVAVIAAVCRGGSAVVLPEEPKRLPEQPRTGVF